MTEDDWETAYYYTWQGKIPDADCPPRWNLIVLLAKLIGNYRQQTLWGNR